VRLEIQLARPAFVYVVWIDSSGKSLPVYPWEEGDWSRREPNESVHTRLSLPSGPFDYWTMEPGPVGMETVVLLARRSPLPESVSIRSLLSEFRNHALPLQSGIWRFVNGQKVGSKKRGPNLQRTATVGDALTRFQWRLVDVLRPHFDLVQTISFPFLAEQSSRDMVSSVGAKPVP
jgi:hypothetical protein